MAGMDICLCVPEGFDLPQAKMDAIIALAAAQGTAVWIERDPEVAVKDASALYSDVWISMGQNAEADKISALRPYQLNRALLSKARADAIVLHCLPAHRGDEITDEVMDGPWSAVFDQAENRLHAQKALMAFLIGGAQA
jgi:ornithine carbamoyltransferase